MKHIGLHRLEGLNGDFREAVEQLLDELADKGIFVAIVSGLRTIAEQNKLYAQGRKDKGNIVTNAMGGQSPHNFGCAVDLVPLNKSGQINWNDNHGFAEIGVAAESIGLVWGGKFKSIVDLPHVESPSWRALQAAWRSGSLKVA